MPRRYKQGADGQPHPAFYGKLPEEFSKTDTMRFMVETDLKLSGCVSADTLAALRAEGYAKPLTEKQMEDYELKPAPANPDRARPSITARLKDGARGQEPPKEPSQKRDHKNHEER